MRNCKASTLPPGWTWTTLGEIGDYHNGRAFKKSEWRKHGRPIVRIQDLTGTGSSPNYFEGEVEPQHEVHPGDLLVSWAATLGAYIWKGREAVLNQHIFKVDSFIHKGFHYYLLQSALSALRQQAHGTGMVHVTKGKFEEVPVALPPFREQQRIFEQIEGFLSRLDAATSILDGTGIKLKIFKASLLRAACEGRLIPTETELAPTESRTSEQAEHLLELIREQRKQCWEEQLQKKVGHDPERDHWKAKYRHPLPANARSLPPLPRGWIWASLEEISTKVVDGVHKKPSYVKAGVPFVTVRNLTAGPGIDLNRLNYVRLEDHRKFIERAHPERDDILISKDGTLGVVRAIRTEREFSIFVSVALVKPVLKQTSEYLEIALSSPQVQAQMLSKGSGLQHIHLEDLRRVCIPLPPLNEQTRIVTEVQRRLSIIEQMQGAVRNGLARAATLRHSILKTALAGKLSLQDPVDEPASTLLERIRSARNPEASGVRTRRSRPEPPPQSENTKSESRTEAAATEPDSKKPPFVEHDPSEQTNLAWEILFGRGLFEKEDAVRAIAEGLRNQGLAHFQRLRKDGPLFNDIASAIDRGVRQGFFDRPKRGHVRAILADPKAYSPDDWRLCLLGALDGAPIEKEDALRAAAELARETMGLEFARLREDGVILKGLRAALKEAVGRGEVARVGRGRIRRAG